MSKVIPEFEGTIKSGLSNSSPSSSAAIQHSVDFKSIELSSTLDSKPNVNGDYDRSSKKNLEKRYEADQKRQESLKRQRDNYSKQHYLINSALKSIDSPTGPTVNKKTKFASSSSSSSSSSDSETDEEKSISKTKRSNSKIAPPSTSTIKNGNDKTIKSTGRQQLFDEEDGEKIELDISKKKFDGILGSKLLQLQSKYGGLDQRFRMDERFLDDETDQTGDRKKNGIDPEDEADSLNKIEERRTNFRILEKVLGKPIPDKSIAPNDEERNGDFVAKVPYLRYDPENPAHRKFQKVQEDDDEDEDDEDDAIDRKPAESDSDRESDDQGDQDEDADADSDNVQDDSVDQDQDQSSSANPHVDGLDTEFAQELKLKIASTEKPWKVDRSSKPIDSGFSLRKLFGRDTVDTSEPMDEHVEQTDDGTKPIFVPDWQKSILGNRLYKDSSDEEDGGGFEEEMEHRKTSTTTDQSGKPKQLGRKLESSTFFFYDETDPRIIAEAHKFRRLDDLDVVRKRWEKQRLGLIQFCKGRRKEAVKKQRLRREEQESRKGKRRAASSGRRPSKKKHVAKS